MAFEISEGLLTAKPGFLQGLEDANALTEQSINNYINRIQAQYAPLTIPAKALSELAYTQLVGPQYLAKLMQNPVFVANLPPNVAKNLPGILTNVGLSVTGMPNKLLPESTATVSTGVSQPTNKLETPSTYSKQSFSQQPTYNTEIRDANRAWYNRPESQKQLKEEGMLTVPPQNQLLNWYRQQQPISQPIDQTQITPQTVSPVTPSDKKDYFETAGQELGKQKEQEKLGELRAQTMQDFGNIYQSTLSKETTLNDLSSILQEPEIRNAMNMPILQRPTIGILKRTGSTKLKELLGRLTTDIGEIIKDSAGDFKGQFRKGEQSLLNSMKVNDDDNIDVAIGKLQSLMLFNKMQQERSMYAHDVMRDKHLDSLDALRETEKVLNQDKVKKEIYDKLHPTVRIRSKKDPNKILTISRSELGNYIKE